MLVLVIMRVTATSLRVGLPRARERLAAISAVAAACTAPRRGIAATAVDARRHDAYRLFVARFHDGRTDGSDADR